MSELILSVIGIIGVMLLGMLCWRWFDQREEKIVWTRLAALQPVDPARFDPAMLQTLPAPAQRYLRYAIAPGTPLFSVAEVTMQGTFRLSSSDQPGDMTLQAEQVLAAPYGFLWRMSAAAGLMNVSGSDMAEGRMSWSHFWLQQLIPVARVGGDADHRRSAFGRCVAEAVFWTPAVLLTSENVEWEAVDESLARVIFRFEGLEQAVDLFVEPDGRLAKIVFQRWSDANPQKRYQLQPFGGHLSRYRNFHGFNLPTRIEAGNFFGTDKYFEFFKVDVIDVCFPDAADNNPDGDPQQKPR